MDQRQWQVRAAAIPVALLIVSFYGCARRPAVAQLSAPAPTGSAGAGVTGGQAPTSSAGSAAPSAGAQGASGAASTAGNRVVNAAPGPSAGGAGQSTGTSGPGAGTWRPGGESSRSVGHGVPGATAAEANTGPAGGAGGTAGGPGAVQAGGRAGGAAGVTAGGAGGGAGAGVAAGPAAGGPGAGGQVGTMVAAARPQPSEYHEATELSDIHFDFDKYDIRPGDAKILGGAAAWLKANPRTLLLIEGHCDERGTNEYNLALGEHRANSAMRYLASQGVAEHRITVISYGEERPLCTEHTEACWAKNRRAHFLVKPE